MREKVQLRATSNFDICLWAIETLVSRTTGKVFTSQQTEILDFELFKDDDPRVKGSIPAGDKVFAPL